MKSSFVYRNLHVYRLVMNVLYRGGYRARFARITDLLGTDVGSVCELCFGDTVIAGWCRDHAIPWVGVDVNHGFCERARGLGFDVREGDLLSVELPPAGAYVMSASLYHFHDHLAVLFDRILDRTSRFILAEPIRNLAASSGLVGWVAKRMANPGTGVPEFRFNEPLLLGALEAQRQRKGFEMRVLGGDRDLLIEIRR